MGSYTTHTGDDGRSRGLSLRDGVDADDYESSGVTVIRGDLRADTATLSGVTTVTGDVDVIDLDASGAGSFSGDVDAESVSISGGVSVAGTVRARTVETSGGTDLSDVDADRFEASGGVSVDDVTADELRVSGGISAARLAGETVRLDLSGDSTVERIEGGDVTVTRRQRRRSPAIDFTGLADVVRSDSRGHLDAGFVGGDVVRLDHADVETVAADRVELGPGAHVGTLRANEVTRHEDAIVDREESL